MENEDVNTVYLAEVEKEYAQIHSNWLILHYKISIGVVVFALFVECMMSLLFVDSDVITISLGRYLLKYIAVPSGLNFILIGLETMALKADRLSQKQKIYIVSLTFVFICFVVFCAHSALTSTYYIFTGAVMLTIIYANYRLTCLTALLSVISIILSELVIKWDADKPDVLGDMMLFGDFLVSIIVLLAFSAACMVVIRFERKKNRASLKKDLERYELKQSLQRDELTGIYNRKALQEALANMENQETDRKWVLATADLDHFKGINDNWGHSIGDRCLKEFARILKENEMKYISFRYGGDEFCLLFPDAVIDEAVSICERIRDQVEKVCLEGVQQINLTASFGIAAYSPDIDGARLFIHSDHALYEAKKCRNAIFVYDESKMAAKPMGR
jgi:diguanylate cyclase (GGDEF)-like protein